MLAALAAALAIPAIWPGAERGLFSRGAAVLAGSFLGSAPVATDGGWRIALSGTDLLVTADCSGTGFFALAGALIAWRLVRCYGRPAAALPLALIAALPFALAVNACRLVVVAGSSGFAERFPADYAAALHLLAGTAVFFPALIGLNLAFEIREHRRFTTADKPR